MSKIPSPIVQMESYILFDRSHFFLSLRKLYIFFGIFWNSTNLAYVPKVWPKFGLKLTLKYSKGHCAGA